MPEFVVERRRCVGCDESRFLVPRVSIITYTYADPRCRSSGRAPCFQWPQRRFQQRRKPCEDRPIHLYCAGLAGTGRRKADITDIIRQLHEIVDDAIETQPDRAGEESKPYDISKIDFDRLRKEFERSSIKRTTVQNLKQVIEQRLQRLLSQNPLRTDFQRHYEEIVADYNREKDRVTVEKTFEALLKLVQGLDEEDSRAVREGLDEESLAIFDLLKKPELAPAETKRIKAVAVDLIETLKAEKLRVDHWRDKEATRDAVRLLIKDYLWSDETGLPSDSYSEDDVASMAEEVFRHVYRAYPQVPSPLYAQAS